MTTKDVLRLNSDHLRPNPRRRFGVQGSKMVPCDRSPANHGHHPAGELCPMCEAPWERVPATERTDEPAASKDANAKAAYEMCRRSTMTFLPEWDDAPGVVKESWIRKYP